MYLKDLTNLDGISGNEDAIRAYIAKQIKEKVDDLFVDSMGNLIAFKKGTQRHFSLMLAAHMDEVGFMVTGFGDMGSIKFKPVGGIDPSILPGKKVFIGDNKVPGVIAIKPIHQQDQTERSTKISLNKLILDIGSDKKEETEKIVSLGDSITFSTQYKEFGNGFIRAKALDDRVGCSILMEVLDRVHPYDLYACFTVQEEVGLRGAEIASYRIHPDIALVLEGTTCSDIPGIPMHETSTHIGKGPALTFMDGSSIMDKPFMAFIETVAKKHRIPYQWKQTISGGNDAGKIQRSRKGVRVGVISAPIRYIHSPVSVMQKSDYDHMKTLVTQVLEEIPSWMDKP